MASGAEGGPSSEKKKTAGDRGAGWGGPELALGHIMSKKPT